MPRTAGCGFDTALVDRENDAVALVQVNGHPVEEKPRAAAHQKQKRDIVDFRSDAANLRGPLFQCAIR